MKKFIKQLCIDLNKIYLYRIENDKKVKRGIISKPFIFYNLDREEYKIYIVNLIEKTRSSYNKYVVEIGSKLLNNLDKYDIDVLALSERGVLWGEFIHEIIPTKKNNKQIYLSFKGRNYIKKIYGRIGVDEFIKKMFAMQFTGGGKSLFIDSTERFKKTEKRLTEALFGLSNIPSIYYVNKQTNEIYITCKKTHMIILLNLLGIPYNVEDIKIIGILKIDKIKKYLKEYLLGLYGYNARKKIEMQGTFLNSYSNLKDVSNMVEGPNDIFQDWLRKLGVPYDDQYIKRIIVDDLITDSNLEGFFLNYKNLDTDLKKEERLEKIKKLLIG